MHTKRDKLPPLLLDNQLMAGVRRLTGMQTVKHGTSRVSAVHMLTSTAATVAAAATAAALRTTTATASLHFEANTNSTS